MKTKIFTVIICISLISSTFEHLIDVLAIFYLVNFFGPYLFWFIFFLHIGLAFYVFFKKIY